MSFPARVLERIERRCGPLLGVEPSHGMSGASVHIARGAEDAVVVKASTLPAESWFYRDVAPRLRARGVPIPAAEPLGVVDRKHWLLVEYLPIPLSTDATDWEPDQRVIDGLVALHRATRGADFGIPRTTRARWTPERMAQALEALPPEVAQELSVPLDQLRNRANRLSDPWCWISGDPSPPNWAARDDGTLMLFDWELFRPGVAAADLAPVAPGLASFERISRVADIYATRWAAAGGDALPWRVHDLARDAALAKVMNVVLILAEYNAGDAEIPGDYADKLIEAFPGWLRSLLHDLG